MLYLAIVDHFSENERSFAIAAYLVCYCFHRLIMGKVEIGNFYRLIGDNRILFSQICLLNSSPHFIRLLLELLNLIGCRGNINSYTPQL